MIATPEAEIRRRIAERGPITFAEFMELALYHPAGGYYTSGDPVGSGGDFYTSPTVHPAFGALLAVQLYQMWQLLGQPAPFTVVEPGAANGLLCRDILSAANGLPSGFADSLRYVCVDRRARSQASNAVCQPPAASPPQRCRFGASSAASCPTNSSTPCPCTR